MTVQKSSKPAAAHSFPIRKKIIRTCDDQTATYADQVDLTEQRRLCGLGQGIFAETIVFV